MGDLKEFGETLQISASKDGLRWNVKEPVVATFALAYLVKFAKAAPLSGQVEIGVGAEMPISVKFDLDTAENGHMQFHLAKDRGLKVCHYYCGSAKQSFPGIECISAV